MLIITEEKEPPEKEEPPIEANIIALEEMKEKERWENQPQQVKEGELKDFSKTITQVEVCSRHKQRLSGGHLAGNHETPIKNCHIKETSEKYNSVSQIQWLELTKQTKLNKNIS